MNLTCFACLARPWPSHDGQGSLTILPSPRQEEQSVTTCLVKNPAFSILWILPLPSQAGHSLTPS